MSETRPAIGYEGVYAVSAGGDVFRIDGDEPRKLKIGISKVGYPVVSLWKNNRGKTHYVHRMVLEAWVSPCPPGMEALHGDGNRLNCSLSNLRWGTRAENVADAIRHGTATIGFRNGQARLSPHDIGWIKDMRSMGFFHREIAKAFGVSMTTIIKATTGVTYKGSM